MHWRKENERGFNQSELLAKIVSQTMKIPFTKKLLVKNHPTTAQVTLKKKERIENQQQVFSVPYTVLPQTTIFLIDDVCTTGATLSSAANVLKKAGADEVFGLVIAHGH